jgi:hypothetical protein
VYKRWLVVVVNRALRHDFHHVPCIREHIYIYIGAVRRTVKLCTSAAVINIEY